MAMAYKPPITSREFRYWIRDHAVERFRERVEEEFQSRSDADLGRLLDERCHHALVARKVNIVIDSDAPDEDTSLVEIESRTGVKSVVVMRMIRPSQRPMGRCVGSPGIMALGAITVLTAEQAAANMARGKWHVPNRPLAGKLAGIIPTKPVPAPTPIIATPPVSPSSSPADEDDSEDTSSTLVERLGYARIEIQRRPSIRISGKDGIVEFVKKRFGKGLSWQTATQLKEQVLEEMERGVPMAPALVELPVTQTRMVASAPVASSSAPTAMRPTRTAVERDRPADYGAQLSEALAEEARCKVIEHNAITARERATSRVEAVMKNIQAARE